MKEKCIRKTMSALLSVLMFQSIALEHLLFVSADDFHVLNETTVFSATDELDKELQIYSLPSKLLSIIERDQPDAVQLDETFMNDMYSVGTVNNDGTKSLFSFGVPIKYHDDDGTIRFIDNSIVLTEVDGNTQYVNRSNAYQISFPESLSDGLDFSMNGFAFNIKPTGVNSSEKPQINENEIVYTEVFDYSTSIQYSLDNLGFKESIIVSEPNGCISYEYVFTSDSLAPYTEDNRSIILIDEKSGEPVYTIQPTYIVDSYSGEYVESEQHISYDNYYEIETISDHSYLIRMILDEDFLNSESTVYPCIIDPSVWSVTYSNDSSSYVMQSGGSGNIESQLSAGIMNGSGEHLSYVKASSVNKLKWIEPNRIQSALFKVKSSSSGYSNNCTINCYDSLISSSVSTVTYTSLLSALGTFQSSTVFTTLGATYAFDVTSLFRNWLSYELGEGGKSAAYGFILKGATGACTPGRWFSSTSSSDTYFYLTYEESDVIEDGFYNIKNVSTGTYLQYNNGGQLSLSQYPSSNTCKWQVIFTKNPDGTATNAKYAISPFNNLNTSIKGSVTNDAVTTNVSGTKYRFVKNADGTFRIMPAGGINARISNAIGLSSGYATIKEYTNTNSMKWTLEPVVNRFFSKYTPDRFNDDEIKDKMNCYGYAMGYMLKHDLSGVYKQVPGEFETQAAINAGLFQNLASTVSADDLLDIIENNMILDANRFGYTITEYTPTGNSIEQFGADSRLIAVVGAYTPSDHLYSRFHFYMQHNDGTWSHKTGAYDVINYYDISGTGRVYLTNENIQIYVGDGSNPDSVYNGYISGSVRYYIVTKDAVADYPHAAKSGNPPTVVTHPKGQPNYD